MSSSSTRPTQVLEFRAGDKPGKDGKHKRATLYTSNASSNFRSWTSFVTPTTTGNSEIVTERTKDSEATRVSQLLHDNLLVHVLPSQYPDSVAPGYGRFAALGFCASVCGSAAMVLSTQTLLLAVGVVGSAQKASIMAGALNWVLKDGIGQLGGVLFASHMGRAGSNHFDADPKRWRVVAALSLDCATLIEILSPLVPAAMVLPVASVANIGKNIGFLTASASRAALHQSLAIKGNLADVTAKAGSQSLAASLLGTALGIGLSPLLGSVTNFALGFVVLSSVHEGCNYASLKAVPLVTLNRHRLHLILHNFVDMIGGEQEILSPTDVAQQEFFLPMVNPDDSHTWLAIGERLETVCPGGAEEFSQLLAASPSEKYILNHRDGMIQLLFFEDSNGEDLILGVLQAYLLRSRISNGPSSLLGAIKHSHRHAKEQFEYLSRSLKRQGWKFETEYVSIESTKARRLAFRS